MKVYDKILSILNVIDECTDIKALKKLETRLHTFLVLFFFCEFYSDTSKSVLTEDQAKKLGKIASILIKKIIKNEVNYKFFHIFILLKLCSWNPETLTKMFKAVHAQSPEILNRWEKFLNYYKGLKVASATPEVIFDTSSQHEKFVALAASYYGWEGIDKISSQTGVYKEKPGPQKIFLSKVAMYLVSEKRFGENESDLKTLTGLIGEGIFTDIKVGNMPISCSDKDFTLAELLALKGYEEVLKSKEKPKKVDAELLFNNVGLFSDKLLLERVKSIEPKWNPDLLKDCIGLAIQGKMLKTIEHLIENNSSIIEETKLITSTAIIKAGTNKLPLNNYQNLLNQYLDFVKEDYVFLSKLLRLFIDHKIYTPDDPIPLLALFFTPSRQEVKYRVFDILMDLGFDIFIQAEKLKQSFIFLVCRQKDFDFLSHVLSNATLNKKYPKLLHDIYEFALGGFIETAHFLKNTYPEELTDTDTQELAADLTAAILRQNYPMLAKILKGAKTRRQDVNPPILYPLKEKPVLQSKKAKVYKQTLQIKEGALYLSPLYLTIIRNDRKAFELLRNAGAQVIISFITYHPLTLAVLFNADQVIELLLQEAEIKSYFEKDNEIVKQEFENVIMGFLFQEKYEYLSQFLSHPGFAKVKLSNKLYFMLIDCEFRDAKIYKKFWSDEYLKDEIIYNQLLINSEYEDFFQDMLDFVMTRLNTMPEVLNDEKIKEHFNFFFALVIRSAAMCKIKLANLPQKDCEHLLKLLGIIVDVADQDLPSRVKFLSEEKVSIRLRVPRGDTSRYLQLANEFLSLIIKRQISVLPKTTASTLNIFELICLGDFSNLLNKIFEYEVLSTQCDKNAILNFSAMLGSGEVTGLLLKYFTFEGHALKKALLASINYNQIAAFTLLLTALEKTYGKTDEITFKKYIKFIYKQVTPQQEFIKSRLASYLEESEIKAVVAKQQQSKLAEITAEVSDDHQYKKPGHFTFRFFDENKKLCYAHVEEKYVRKTESLYEQIANVFLKNNQDQTIANGNIIPLGDDPKYGKGANKPDYKVRFGGLVSDQRGLLFRVENESKKEKVDEDSSKVDEPRVYIARFMSKHRE